MSAFRSSRDDEHDDMIITLPLLGAACDLANKTPSFSDSLTVAHADSDVDYDSDADSDSDADADAVISLVIIGGKQLSLIFCCYCCGYIPFLLVLRPVFELEYALFDMKWKRCCVFNSSHDPALTILFFAAR